MAAASAAKIMARWYQAKNINGNSSSIEK